eukprot:scaffold8485_cov110-Isochrysis_galbana.AAC.6
MKARGCVERGRAYVCGMGGSGGAEEACGSGARALMGWAGIRRGGGPGMGQTPDWTETRQAKVGRAGSFWNRGSAGMASAGLGETLALGGGWTAGAWIGVGLAGGDGLRGEIVWAAGSSLTRHVAPPVAPTARRSPHAPTAARRLPTAAPARAASRPASLQQPTRLRPEARCRPPPAGRAARAPRRSRRRRRSPPAGIRCGSGGPRRQWHLLPPHPGTARRARSQACVEPTERSGWRRRARGGREARRRYPPVRRRRPRRQPSARASLLWLGQHGASGRGGRGPVRT